MGGFSPSFRRPGWLLALLQFRIWQITLLVAFVAIAIVEIQQQRTTEPNLILLAVAGFAVYGLIVWVGWHCVKRWEGRIGSMLAISVYVVAMGILYLVATIVYLVVEYEYRGGRFYLILSAFRRLV